MPKRHEWEFAYTASQVLASAKVKLVHHQGRVAYWTEERDKAQEDLRANGIDFSEVIDLTPSYANYTRDEPEIDKRRFRHLRETQAKLREHEAHVAVYTKWVSVLNRERGERELLLHEDDVEFFGLGSDET